VTGEARKPLVGIAFKLIATAIFAVMGVCAKLVADTIPTNQIVFARSAFALVPILVLMAMAGGIPRQLATARPGAHLWRTVMGTTAMAASFAALAYIPLHEQVAIGFAMPIFAVILAAVLLKEVVRVYRWTAVGLGLVGVLVILSPHLSNTMASPRDVEMTTIGAVLALAAAFLAAFAMVTVRALTKTEATNTIVAWFSIGGAVLALATAPVVPFAWPSAREAVLLVAIGLLGGVAQVFLTKSYHHADASVIAPFEYSQLLFAVILGFWVFGDVPGWTTLAGATIVIASGLFVIWREHVLGLERRKENAARS
jgi:drug/metabolite transporter (DMT)-like permease